MWYFNFNFGNRRERRREETNVAEPKTTSYEGSEQRNGAGKIGGFIIQNKEGVTLDFASSSASMHVNAMDSGIR